MALYLSSPRHFVAAPPRATREPRHPPMPPQHSRVASHCLLRCHHSGCIGVRRHQNFRSGSKIGALVTVALGLYCTVGGCERKRYPAHKARRSATGARSSLCKHEQVMGTASHCASVPARTSVSCHRHYGTGGHSRSPRHRRRTGARGDAIATAQAEHRCREDAPRSPAATTARMLPGRRPPPRGHGPSRASPSSYVDAWPLRHRSKPRFRIPIRAPSCCSYDFMAACAMRPSSKNGEAQRQTVGAVYEAHYNGGSRRCALGGGEAWRGAGVPRGAVCHSKAHGAAVCHSNPRGAAV